MFNEPERCHGGHGAFWEPFYSFKIKFGKKILFIVPSCHIDNQALNELRGTKVFKSIAGANIRSCEF